MSLKTLQVILHELRLTLVAQLGLEKLRIGCMTGLGMPRKPCEKRHSKFYINLRYEGPHVCGLGATIGVVPCGPPIFQPHGPMPYCSPPQLWGGILDIDYPPLAPQFYCGSILDVNLLAGPP
jgi:hypothetical protein